MKGAFAERTLIRRAQLLDGEVGDVRLDNGVIVAIAPSLAALEGERVVEARGGALLPGLQDHHLHLFATAAARSSVDCSPAAVQDETGLFQRLQRQSQVGDEPIRGVGFHDSVCPVLDRHWLDRCCGDRIVRIQHRSGMMWVYNSAAIEALRLANGEDLPEGAECDASGRLTGRFYNLDAWLGQRFQGPRRSLAALSRHMAKMGITGVTDTGVNNDVDTWQRLKDESESGRLCQKLLMMGREELAPLMSINRDDFAVGAVKLYLREHRLPELAEFVGRIRHAHEQVRNIAIHCVTRTELVFALAALREAGVIPGDRIEHAAIADSHALLELAELGLTVVTQPHFLAERGDQYLREVEPEDLPLLYRGAGFLRAGVALAGGSDAPYGNVDPWASMRAAMSRQSAAGHCFAEQERLTAAQALALYGGEPHRPGGSLRRLAVGQAADLCLLDTGWSALLADLDARHVAATFCGGALVYLRDTCPSASAKVLGA